VETIEELKKICQGTIHKDVSNVYMRYVCRPLSIRLTRLLLPTAITADQVSQAMIAAGFLSAFVLALPWNHTFLLGALLLQGWYLIDCMDGEVARYRYYQKTGRISIDKRDTSLTGMYYDLINHYIMNFLVPSAVAIGVYFRGGGLCAILAGMAAALGQVLLLAMHDTRYRAILQHLRKYKMIRVLENKSTAYRAPSKNKSPAHVVFAMLHYSMTYPSVMNLVLLVALAACVFPVIFWEGFLLAYLSAGSVLVAAVLIVRAIQHREPDIEFTSHFSVSDENASV